MQRRSRNGWLLLGPVLVLSGAGCNSGDDQGPGESPLVIEKPVTKSGDQQTGPVSVALGNPLRVQITRDGEPVEEVAVSWATGNGGSFSGTTDSDADGIASTVWTLGPEVGNQAATATVTGADGSPLTYTAEAVEDNEPPPAVTVEVLGPEGGNRFEPADVTVFVGQTVTWNWPEGSLDHNVRPDGTIPVLSGPPVDGPTTYSYTFQEAGSFRYHCLTHGGPGGVGMSGRVLVLEGQP